MVSPQFEGPSELILNHESVAALVGCSVSVIFWPAPIHGGSSAIGSCHCRKKRGVPSRT
jgi:hypothetical protein